MKTKQLHIHSENILPIIKKWLYSEKEIFIRELVSNSCDAIQKRKILHDSGSLEGSFTPRIDITIDKEKKTLTFSDNGIGMSSEEMEKYLAQIAFSGAEEFAKTYETSDSFIGHFGLGFYSAYMVADTVSVHSLSAQGDEPAQWTCDGSTSYQLEKGSRTEKGTDVILHIDKDNEEFCEEGKLRSLLLKFCQFLPYEIYFNDSLINPDKPLWTKQPQECTKEEYLTLFRSLYPLEPDPLFWVHINVEYPFHVKGILFFPQIGRNFDFQKSAVKLFCNRVFVSDDCRDVLPEYLTMLRGAIDSPDIPLNVSRSYLQVDRTVRKLAAHISKKVGDSLVSLFKKDKEQFLNIWKDIEVIVKLGVLHDEKFYSKVKDILLFKTLKDEWMTIEECREKQESEEKTIFYTALAHPDPHLADIYHEKGHDVLIAPSSVDAALLIFLEKKLEKTHCLRIDSGEQHIIDGEKENTLVDENGKTKSTNLEEFLQNEGYQVKAKSLASEALPGFISLSEEERRFRDYMLRMNQDIPSEMMPKPTFIANTNSPLINKLYDLKESHPELAKSLGKQIIQLAHIANREMDPKDVSSFVKDTYALLDNLLSKVQ